MEEEKQEYCDGQHILLVDDDEFNIYTLRKLFEIQGILVEEEDTAMDGKEAIQKIASKKCKKCNSGYWLVITDLNMPVMDGYKATTIIRKMISDGEISQVNIVGTTANSIDYKMKQKCLSIGFDDVISKPIMKKVLIKVLDSFYYDLNI